MSDGKASPPCSALARAGAGAGDVFGESFSFTGLTLVAEPGAAGGLAAVGSAQWDSEV